VVASRDDHLARNWVADFLNGHQSDRILLKPLFSDGLAISIITYAEVYEGVSYGKDRRCHEQGFSLPQQRSKAEQN
jgi:hypothetical protein